MGFPAGSRVCLLWREYINRDCRVYNCSSLFTARGDIGDLFSTISLKNIVIEAERDVSLFSHKVFGDFDYAHPVRIPDRVIIEKVFINKPYKFDLSIDGFYGRPYGRFRIQDCEFSGKINGSEFLKEK